MSKEDQGNACRISLSQPDFLFLILLIWTLRCLYEMRNTYSLWEDIIGLRTISSIKDSLVGVPDDDHDEPDDDGDHVTEEAMIVGMTIPLKLFVSFILFLRFSIACLLWFLGCRWLTATDRFADLILNAIALEFIMDLKELIYTALMPFRNKLDLAVTKIQPQQKKLAPGFCAFVNTFLILVIGAILVALYMRFQCVLPDYQWDVKEVCTQWIAERFCTTVGCMGNGTKAAR